MSKTDLSLPGTSTQKQGEKRKAEDILVDPDTNQPIEDAKRPKVDLDAERKYKCIKTIVDAYNAILDVAFPKPRTIPSQMEIDVTEDSELERREASRNVTVGNHIISIIFTLHNTFRQKVKPNETNMIKKTKETSFKIHYKGKDIPMTTESLMALWSNITQANGLTYKDFSLTDKDNWYGTMGPYLDMFASYALRVNELRLGHNNMPITKQNGIHKSFPISKYGPSGAHHVLLEGTSFPPERRSSIVQSLGPMTAWLCMIRTEGVYRRKYAAAVKRAMAHVPCIDDIIEITKTTKQASEISMLTTLVAEILLITSSRQATRIYFPIAIFEKVWTNYVDKKRLCNFFSTTGSGGWYVYKKAVESGITFTISGEMESEMASQILFHGMFGTFKEDLSILAQITDVNKWYTREEMGSCFRNQGTTSKVTKIQLPKVRLYSKMSCANQTGLLTGVYNQVATVPCFSGSRIHLFDSNFFEHIEKRKIISTTGKTIPQIVNILTTTLEELHKILSTGNGKMNMGTTKWRDMRSLDIDSPGDSVEEVLVGKSIMFLGKH